MTLEVELIRNVTPSFGHSIDVGRVRSNNQDALVACAMVVRDHGDNATNFGLFAVADGMGGHIDGEKASAQVASTITEQVLSKIYLPLLQQEPGATDWMEEVDDRLPIADVLSDALRSANTTIISKIPNSGTTATLCVLVGNTLHLAHIGDSRAYLISEGGIEQITRDHSLAQRLFEVGQLTREEMGSFPRRNELYKVLGFTEDIEPDVGSRRLTPGTYLLICSDGLWGEVPDPLIEDVVLSAATPQAACDRLVALANERGGHDNISVVIVQMPRVA
ncbi:MAG: protein phosphatase 2C domain-containing protein [Anaerolineae bacterium]|nr:protein phosphatase 2C domain-containing protein [Anaerolineae bacterium]